MSSARRFPIILTIVTLISLAILCWLGSWQLKRLAWKTDLLARIEALKTAPAQPVDDVLALAARGRDMDFTRVEATCAASDAAPPVVYLIGILEGRAGFRLQAPCHAAGHLIIVDRGFAPISDVTHPPRTAPPLPVQVTGILRRPSPLTGIQGMVSSAQNNDIGWQTRQGAISAATPPGQTASPYILIAEHETPAPPGFTAAPLPVDIPNRHLEYALTWFGLAGALLAIYGAMLWRRFKPS